jgi:hypothetical protein
MSASKERKFLTTLELLLGCREDEIVRITPRTRYYEQEKSVTVPQEPDPLLQEKSTKVSKRISAPSAKKSREQDLSSVPNVVRRIYKAGKLKYVV